MSYYYRSSESKLDTDDDDNNNVEDHRDDGTTTTTTTPTNHTVPYYEYLRSSATTRTTSTGDQYDRHHHVDTQPRRTRYGGRLHRRLDATPTTDIINTPTSTPYEATVTMETSSILNRFRLHRGTATSTHSSSLESNPPMTEESSTSFIELLRRHRQREITANANANAEDHDEGEEEEEEEEEEEYDEEEVDGYDDEEEEEDEMDDGSTAVTIRAPTERRSSTPIWSASGMASTGDSTDMGTNDIPDIGITTQTSTGTTTSAAPITTDGTDPDELLVGSGSSADGGDTTIAASSTNTTSMIIAAKPNLHNLFEKPYLREIGIEDILSFQLSSAKPGNGVEQLCDPSLETYWQSDGVSQPHWIQIQLPRRLPVTHVALYLDYQLDESYTPRTVQIETGLTVVQDTMFALSNHSTALSDAPIMELHEPVGWCIFPIHIPPDPFDTNISDHNNGSGGVVINETTMIPRSHWVRISVLSMHQNGRDTHIRRVALFCQRTTMTMRMPQPPPVHPPIVSTKESAVHANEDDPQNDHEEILLYARTRSTFPTYDPMMTIQPLGNIRVNQQQHQQSSLFGTIR